MTREEAKEVFLNRGFIDGIYDGNKWREACIVISKWLEQESVIDKIRAKIEQSRYGLVNDGLDLAINIIDECVAESEDKE